MTAYEMFLPIISLCIVALGIYMIAISDREHKKWEESQNKTQSEPNLKTRGIVFIVLGLIVFSIGIFQALV